MVDLGSMIMTARFIILMFFAMAASTVCRAAEITEVQSIDFGTFALWDNAAPRTIVIQPDGTSVYSSGIVPDVRAKRGEYLLADLPPNMSFTLGVTVPNPPSDGGVTIDNSSGLSAAGGTFTVTQFTTNALSTDGAGSAILYIGATLTSSATGMYYQDGPYTGTVELTFFY
jgi:hypothetical protein